MSEDQDQDDLTREESIDVPAFLRREDIPLYLRHETFHQLWERLTNDKDEFIYCLLLWWQEADSRCFPDVSERYMVQKIHEGKVSHTTIEDNGEVEEFYIPQMVTVDQQLQFGRLSEDDRRKIIEAGDDYSEILEYCNRLFRRLTLFFIRYAATKGLVLNRLWDFYLSTVDSDYPESRCGDFIYAVGAYCYFSTDEEFWESVQPTISESFRKAMAEMEMLAVAVHPSISINDFNNFYPDQAGRVPELKGNTFSKQQIIDMTGLSPSTILGYEKALLDQQRENGVPEKDRFTRARRGARNHRYQKSEVIDLLIFIRDNNKETEIIENCKKSLLNLETT